MKVLSLFLLVLVAATFGLVGDSVAAEKGSESPTVGEGVRSSYVDPTDMTTVPRLVRKILVRATAKAKRGEHEDAIALLQEHLRDHGDQDHYLVRYHLARSHDALGDYERARQQYARTVEMEPRLAAGWFGLGHVTYNLGDYAGSGEAFLRSFRADADPQPETLYFAAAGYMLAEDHETAAPLLDELCSGRWGTPRHDWYAQLASCAIALQQQDLAIGHLARYLAQNPDSHDAWFLDYQFHVGFKEYREAAVSLTMVSHLRELSAHEQRTLGDLYTMVDVPYLASTRYRASLTDDARAQDYERLVSALVAAHDLDGALAALREGLDTDPTARLWSLLGDVHYLRKDYAAAAEAFAQVAELDPDSGRALLMVGYCHIELGNRGLAIQNLVNAAKYEDQAQLAERLLIRARKMERT
jgi:tetratricopeptide (TPR) repeat protein